MSHEDRTVHARAGAPVYLVVNGLPAVLPPGATVADAVRARGVGAAHRAVAVAVDGDVVPRAAWRTTRLADGARVEVLARV